MSRGWGVEFVNAKEFKFAVDKSQKDLVKKANDLISGAALRTVGIAKMRLQPHPEDSRELSVDIAAVRQSINFLHDRKTLSSSVFAGNVTGDHLAAYLEFGTGVYAARYVRSLPPGFRALAMTFYVNGRGRLKEHPYLIPAYLQEGKRLSERLKGLKISW